MVFVNDKKYACETCIKGHRSSACNHTSRPLYEIKRKGRPVTQCEQCRDLRKNKQLHIKCSCTRDEGNVVTSSGSKKGVSHMLEKVAFPDGLPESLLSEVVVEVERPQCPKHPNNPRCSCPSSSRGTPSRVPSSSRAGPSGAADDERLLARMAELRPVRPKVTSTASTIAGPSRLDTRAHYSGPGSALMPQYDGGPALGRSISADARPFGAAMELSPYWPQQNTFCQCGSEHCICGGMAHNQASLDPLGEWLRRNAPPCSCSQELGGCQCASQRPHPSQEEQYPGFSPLFRTTSSPPNMYGAAASYEYGFGELGSESSFGDVEMSFGDVHESSEDLFRTFRTYNRE